MATKKAKKEITLCCHLKIAAWTGEISGTHLYIPERGYGRGGSTRFYSCDLNHCLPSLADGGFVFDLRPLADHSQLTGWVAREPLDSGDIEGTDITRLSDETRKAAAQFIPMLATTYDSGEYLLMAGMMATKALEPENPQEAGPFDYVSSAYLAVYWASKGARVGRRAGNLLTWNDGEKQDIEPPTRKIIKHIISEDTMVIQSKESGQFYAKKLAGEKDQPTWEFCKEGWKVVCFKTFEEAEQYLTKK